MNFSLRVVNFRLRVIIDVIRVIRNKKSRSEK